MNRTLFGDILPSVKVKKQNSSSKKNTTIKKRPLSPANIDSKDSIVNESKKARCSICAAKPLDPLCQACTLLKKSQSSDPTFSKAKKKIKKQKIPFNKLFENISFALSGYVNPQRDEIRSKALKMGAKYVANPDTINNKCTYLICAFKNTPKSQQLKGHCKIVNHKFIEDCFSNKKR